MSELGQWPPRQAKHPVVHVRFAPESGRRVDISGRLKLGYMGLKMEAMMPEQSSVHFYLNWAKERIDEMDATLASLEAKAGQVQADSKIKASELIADLQKRRDQFQADMKKQAEAGEAAWQSAKPQLESRWGEFEAQVKT